MRDTFYLPGFASREISDRPRIHFCGVWDDECWRIAAVPPRISIMSQSYTVNVELPHRHQVTGWRDAATREPWDNPRQWWFGLTVWDHKRTRYWWPFKLERDRRRRVAAFKAKREGEHEASSSGV